MEMKRTRESKFLRCPPCDYRIDWGWEIEREKDREINEMVKQIMKDYNGERRKRKKSKKIVKAIVGRGGVNKVLKELPVKGEVEIKAEKLEL